MRNFILNVWIGWILYMEMTHATRAANKSTSVTIPSARGAVDVSVALSVAERPTFPFEVKGMAEGAVEENTEGNTEGANEGTTDRPAEGLVDGVAEGGTEGLPNGDTDGATEGMTEGAAEGLFVGADERDAVGLVGSSLSPGSTKSGRSNREG
jgi:hypothetical protein